MGPLIKWITKTFKPFRKLKFMYKLSIYFTLFGLFIAYCSFVIYTHLAAKQIMYVLSEVVDEWVTSDSSGNDSILNYIGMPYESVMKNNSSVLKFVLKVLSQNSRIKGITIYYYDPGRSGWFYLNRDSQGYIRANSDVAADKIPLLESSAGRRIDYTDSFLSTREGTVDFRVNLTESGDRGVYIVEISADRMGILKYMGGVYIIPVYALCLFFISLVLSRVIAFHISMPIQKLSFQASQIAEGNLDIRTRILSRDEIGDLSSSINKMADEIRDYLCDINERMDVISVMNRIDKAVLSSTTRGDLIERVTSFVSELFSGIYIALGIADRAEKKYHIVSEHGSYIIGSGMRDIDLSGLDDNLIAVNRGFYIIDPEHNSDRVSYINAITGRNFSSFINIPISLDDEYIGSFIAARMDNISFTKFEVDTLRSLADQVGVAMKSVRFVEERDRLYMGIITALSKAIDAKSRWTAGHSERVAYYSVKIAEALGMPEKFVSEVRMAAILHDIGKIGVPESLLDKPGRLTEEECNIVKEHPYKGALIVSEIPGTANVLKGIRSHHEAWDGSGYPFGLAGEAIPLVGRIIAVADVYDSLVSDRPYRKGWREQDVLDYLLREKGKHFDPRIVDVLIGITGE